MAEHDDPKNRDNLMMGRRQFLAGAGAFGAIAGAKTAFATPLRYFKPTQVDNPLAAYPDRDWEKVYRDIYSWDSSFSFLCAPNDTHNCLLKAYVKNGVMVRIGPTYGYGKAEDLYGNKSSPRWDPRLCQKGLALGRRVYGDRRVKSPMVRRGFKEWADLGFPRDATTGKPDAKYFNRGRDQWLRINWDEAADLSAKAMLNIAETYTGEKGAQRLKAQGYDHDMIETMHGAGVQTLKFRGGMALLGATRIFGLYRFANSLALLDAKLRNVKPEESYGARGWDSYSWHTDLPPGHPMVHGMQTNEFELFATEHAKLILVWGMNWITTKMPDSHWMTEARLKGTKTISITVEYSATASKTDEVVIIRPGTDPALALGIAQVMIQKKLFDESFIKVNTDLPFLVRTDTLQPLRPSEVWADYQSPEHKSLAIVKKGDKPAPPLAQPKMFASETMAGEFQPFLVWDSTSKKLVAVTRDEYGKHATMSSPDLRYAGVVKLADGKSVKVRTIFSLTEEYLNKNMTPAHVEKITGAPATAVVTLAEQIAANKEKTLFACGMGPNQFFNADLKDRAIFLVAALSRNIGFPGGNVGSYAGNYRVSLIGGEPLYALEDPFNPQMDPKGKPTVNKRLKYESLHYFNYGDRPLKQGKTNFTGASHMPAPTKSMWLNNSNSVIGNTKWHYDVVFNTLPKVEFVAFADWWWTGSCEYADLVFAVDSWAEFKSEDMTASCTNPFLQMYPRTPLPRIFNTKSDIECIALVANRMAELTKEDRFAKMFKFALEGKTSVYLQRIIDGSVSLKGYDVAKIEEKAMEGIPVLANTRSYPRSSSLEQVRAEMPWYTKSGRLEFYRPEQEFIDSGENMIVYREPVDSTPYEPNVIVANKHDAIRPKSPEDHGMKRTQIDCEARQVRNVLVSPEKLRGTKHPLRLKNYSFIYHTPKYRHGAHSTPVDTDATAVWFGPFGDVYRHDKRAPFVTEGYMDINPLDARALGLNDGDYVWVDSDPEDRPFRDFQKQPENYKIARLMLRARFYPGTPRGITRTWHNMYGATPGSVAAQASRPDGLAKTETTGYQAMYRSGSHQSATRAWLRPTLMTESLVYKDTFGQGMAKGFTPDIHCPVGAPREAVVKITKAEDGGIENGTPGKGLWRPASLGFRPTYENAAMKEYLKGGFLKNAKKKSK